MRPILVPFLLLMVVGVRAGVWDSAFRTITDAADVASGKSLFKVAQTDVIVQVKKHPYGADLIEITTVKPNYPVDLLRAQATKIGELAGTPDRGLIVASSALGGDARLTATRATFATNGIIDRDKGLLHLTPIVQAFAGAPAPYTVHGLTILFNGEQPTSNTLRSFSNAMVRLQAMALQSPPSIEYRVQLLSQDPADLVVPDSAQEAPPEQNPGPRASTVQREGVDWGLWIPLILAAGAAAVLVYFVMLRMTGKPAR